MEQMTIWDFMEPEPEPVKEKGDCHTCRYMFFVHPPKGGTARQSCERSGGCKWEPKKNCFSCASYGQVIDAYTCERLGFRACFEYDAWSKNLNLEPDIGCEYWKEKDDIKGT